MEQNEHIVYVPVSIADELPKANLEIYTNKGKAVFMHDRYWKEGDYTELHGITHWLKSIPLSSLLKEKDEQIKTLTEKLQEKEEQIKCLQNLVRMQVKHNSINQ